MSYQFKFAPVTDYTGVLDLDDIWNCCIEAVNDLDFAYYLVIRTQLGESTIYELGPYAIDSTTLPDSGSVHYFKTSSDAKRLTATIKKFLQDVKAVDAKTVTLYEMFASYIDALQPLRDEIKEKENEGEH